jgi:hypothetical protein
VPTLESQLVQVCIIRNPRPGEAGNRLLHATSAAGRGAPGVAYFCGYYAILYHLPPKNFRFLNRLFATPRRTDSAQLRSRELSSTLIHLDPAARSRYLLAMDPNHPLRNLKIRLCLMRGYYTSARRAGNGIFKSLRTAWWITRYRWWHCSLCKTPVPLHPVDTPVGCHVDGCENVCTHLLRGKG